MGESKGNKWVRFCTSVKKGVFGKVLFVLFHWIALGVGWNFLKPKIITESGDIVDLTINEISLLLFTFLPIVVILGCSLISKKIQAGVDKQKTKDKVEIKKIKWEICKIKCRRQLVESENTRLELQNKQLELQNENQQSATEN